MANGWYGDSFDIVKMRELFAFEVATQQQRFYIYKNNNKKIKPDRLIIWTVFIVCVSLNYFLKCFICHYRRFMCLLIEKNPFDRIVAKLFD